MSGIIKRNNYGLKKDNSGEFKDTPYEFQKNNFEKSMRFAKKELGIEMKIIVGPYNKTDQIFSKVNRKIRI
jgi:hypothetical protein